MQYNILISRVLMISMALFLLHPLLCAQNKAGQVIFRPHEIDDVLINPGIGFTTFQRFNGDTLNAGEGWTEGFPIDYQPFKGALSTVGYPQTSIAYWRIYWKFLEPEMQKYRWDLIDQALDTAMRRGQKLMLRIAPYGTGPVTDVPEWYRQMVGDENDWNESKPVENWAVDPENVNYSIYFGGLIQALGERYDGHPGFESVDISIVGAWGEGAGSELLTQKTREKLIDAYTDAFQKTPLITLLMDEKTNQYARSKRYVGWRVDCIGDLGFWASEQNGWTHMYDFYPQSIITHGVKDDWQNAPISLEICGTFLRWRDQEGYQSEDVRYIFDQSLKWHISSFNAKSSPVPLEWQSLVDDWLKKMGYRFVLRRFSYPESVKRNGKLPFETWWENKGVAPCYVKYPLAVRLRNPYHTTTLLTHADITTWLPGDNIYDDAVFVPADLPPGDYELEIALVSLPDRFNLLPHPEVKLAIADMKADGWYIMGKIVVE
ncbi:MAG: DUF4832 domain-containing protein [Saprospiraceae bacterium]|nr:DUF4832 domain-containing protein [Saprospiraceae bacterium]